MAQIIAETEGIRTPTKKRTRKDVENALETFNEKKAAKKAKDPAKAVKPAKAKKVTPAKATVKKAAEKSPTGSANAIPLNFISPTGYVREAAFDPKTKLFYVAFAKSTWAMPSTQAEWDAFEKAVADPAIDIDAFYRKAFRGRGDQMMQVRKSGASA